MLYILIYGVDYGTFLIYEDEIEDDFFSNTQKFVLVNLFTLCPILNWVFLAVLCTELSGNDYIILKEGSTLKKFVDYIKKVFKC